MNLPSEEIVPWRSVHELVRARAEQHGDTRRIEVGGSAMSWAEIDGHAGRLARTLQDAGIEPGGRVCTMMNNRVEQLIVWFACSKLGVVWVPMNTSLLGNDLAYTLHDAKPAALFIEDAMATAFRHPDVEESMPDLRFCVDGSNPAGFGPFQQLLDGSGLVVDGCVAGPGDPAVIIYTGGTTGRPKGVVLPHGAFLGAGYRYRDAFSVLPQDRHYSVLSLCHVGGAMAGVMGPLVADIPSVVETKFSASRYWERVRQTDASIIDAAGTMVTALQQRPPEPGDTEHRARIMPSTAGQLPPGVAEAFSKRFHVELVNLYSLTEIGGILITYNRATSRRPNANGARDVGWVDYAVVDPFDEFLPAGELGEIILRPRVQNTSMLGYHNAPERTAKVWQNLWLHTGDLGRVDDEGFLYFVGRQAHWLRCRGENVSSNEVEAVISDLDGVAEAAVVGVPSELGEEDVKVFIIPSSASLLPHEVVAWCVARIASYKVPRYVEFVDEFPRSSAKREIERHKLRSRPNDGAWDAKQPNRLLIS